MNIISNYYSFETISFIISGSEQILVLGDDDCKIFERLLTGPLNIQNMGKVSLFNGNKHLNFVSQDNRNNMNQILQNLTPMANLFIDVNTYWILKAVAMFYRNGSQAESVVFKRLGDWFMTVARRKLTAMSSDEQVNLFEQLLLSIGEIRKVAAFLSELPMSTPQVVTAVISGV